jgi:hypothetical protein
VNTFFEIYVKNDHFKKNGNRSSSNGEYHILPPWVSFYIYSAIFGPPFPTPWAHLAPQIPAFFSTSSFFLYPLISQCPSSSPSPSSSLSPYPPINIHRVLGTGSSPIWQSGHPLDFVNPSRDDVGACCLYPPPAPTPHTNHPES